MLFACSDRAHQLMLNQAPLLDALLCLFEAEVWPVAVRVRGQMCCLLTGSEADERLL